LNSLYQKKKVVGENTTQKAEILNKMCIIISSIIREKPFYLSIFAVLINYHYISNL